MGTGKGKGTGKEMNYARGLIYVTLTNSTDTEAHLRISEERTKNPFTYLPIKEIKLASGQVECTPLLVSFNNDNKATVFISTTGGKGYGQAGSDIEIDITKSNIYDIELTEFWVYPGDGFWSVEPFRVIKAGIQK